jgi:hypothetical protein
MARPAAAVGVFLARPEDVMAANRHRGVIELRGAVWATGILRIMPATIEIVAARFANRTAATCALVLALLPLAVVATALPIFVATLACAALGAERELGGASCHVDGGRHRCTAGQAEQSAEDAAPSDHTSHSIEARIVHAVPLSPRSGAGCAACELAAAVH